MLNLSILHWLNGLRSTVCKEFEDGWDGLWPCMDISIQEYKHNWRSMHHVLYLSTDIVIRFSWLAANSTDGIKRVYYTHRFMEVLVTILEQIDEESHESESIRMSKTRSSTLFAIYLFDFLLPQVLKLSKCLQSRIWLWTSSQVLWLLLCSILLTPHPAKNWLTRGHGWNGKHNRHQVYHWRHHWFSELSNQAFLHITEG